ncbi:MAG TPA: hypothetical protein VLX92_34810 [Kofleriaceae bacterium]|nr:hypothetical protein [Kofleriaceae bacterium]
MMSAVRAALLVTWLGAVVHADPAPSAPSEPAPPPLAVAVELGLADGETTYVSPAATPSLGLEVGYHVDRITTVGLHLGFAHASDDQSELFGSTPYTLVPIDVAAYVSGTAHDLLWGGVFAGAHFDRFQVNGEPVTWDTGLGLGLFAGLDLVRVDDLRFGAFVSIQTEVGGSTGYEAATAGLSFRR